MCHIIFLTTKEKKAILQISYSDMCLTVLKIPICLKLGIIIISTYVESGEKFLNHSFWVIAVCFFSALISITFWTLVGKFLRRFATNNKFIKLFNYVMSLLLLTCIATFYL